MEVTLTKCFCLPCLLVFSVKGKTLFPRKFFLIKADPIQREGLYKKVTEKSAGSYISCLSWKRKELKKKSGRLPAKSNIVIPLKLI